MMVRKEETARLAALLKLPASSFVAVTGRRRVGKTWLVDQAYQQHICFRMTGIQNGTQRQQLAHFAEKLAGYTGQPLVTVPEGWQQAFMQLKYYVQNLRTKRKKVIFIDELPWVHTPKSGFLQMLAHFWNDFLSKEPNYILVICGSATSWITRQIVNDKGGLHNRLTETIHLKPFTLRETRFFLEGNNLRLNNRQLIELYMAMGGIPYYLEQVKKGETAPVAVERLCFSEGGLLKNEYNNLYRALFNDAADHEAIVEALAKAKGGLTREEILTKSGVTPGGPYNRAMNDLISSGFVAEAIPFGRQKRGALYRLIDEYSVFYHRFIRPGRSYTRGVWSQLSAGQAYKIWAGYAFEALCHKHLQLIKEAMGIGAVYTETGSLRVAGSGREKGFQIDLIIDRNDNAINLCEIKFYNSDFTVTKSYAQELQQRKDRFIAYTGTRKQVFITLITNRRVVENDWLLQAVDGRPVIMEELI